MTARAALATLTQDLRYALRMMRRASRIHHHRVTLARARNRRQYRHF